MLEGLRPVTCRLTPDARRQMAALVATCSQAEEGGPGLLIVSVGSVSRDGDGEAEVLHVVVEPASRSADLRALAQTVEDLLILFITDDGDHAALDGRIIDHAEGDGFFLRDPVSGADNRFRALGGSDWPRWVARGARLGALGPEIRWPGMVPLQAMWDEGYDALLIGDRATGAPAVTLSDAAVAALSACRDVVADTPLSGHVRLDPGATFWLDGSPCREVAAVFLRPGDPMPAGPSLEAGGLSLVLSDVPPGRWADGVIDYAAGVGFCLRITAGPFGQAAGNDNG